MSVAVRRRDGQVDRWDALAGETHWIDYVAQQIGDEIVVYAHSFRRVRERADRVNDLLWWKPTSTKIAHKYGPGEWEHVVPGTAEWPPTKAEFVPRRPAHRTSRLDRD